MPAPVPEPVKGRLFAANSARATSAELVFGGGGLEIQADGTRLHYAASAVRVSPPLAGVPRRLTLPDGASFVTPDNAGVDAVLRAAGGRVKGRRLALLEHWTPARGLVLAGLLLLALLGMRWAVPAVADQGALLLPVDIERRLGQHSFAAIDNVLGPSTLPEARQAEIAALFAELRAAAGLPDSVSLAFRDGGPIGPNALAFPGGPVMVTDQLVALAPSDAGLAGVLAHELGHVEHRHGLRRLARSAAWAALLMVMIGDPENLLHEAATLPALLLDRGYSRAFETEADDRALSLLPRIGMDPRAYAEMLEALRQQCGADCEDNSLLATHPALPERAARIRAGLER